MILYKQGKTVTATSQDIQGFWCWYEQWGERYIGTYTYANGFIHLNVTQGLTSREE